MVQRRTPIIIFVLAIPILTELLTSNIPFPEIFIPVNYLFLILFYSIPILMIREVVLRYRLGIAGLFLLGLAYGFLNEGVVARTLFATGEVMFIEAYQIYNIAGVNFPWIFFMVPWHALCAVIYPIVLIQAMYPHTREESWLSVRQMWIFGSLVAAIGSIMFFNGERFPTISVGYLVFSWLCIIALVYGAFRVSKAHTFSEKLPTVLSRRPFIYGAIFSFWLLGAMVLGGIGAHWLMHIGYAVAVFWLLFRLFVRNGWYNVRDASRFAFGHYVVGSFLTIAVTWGNPLVVIGELIVYAVLVFMYHKITKNEESAKGETIDARTSLS